MVEHSFVSSLRRIVFNETVDGSSDSGVRPGCMKRDWILSGVHPGFCPACIQGPGRRTFIMQVWYCTVQWKRATRARAQHNGGFHIQQPP